MNPRTYLAGSLIVAAGTIAAALINVIFR